MDFPVPDVFFGRRPPVGQILDGACDKHILLFQSGCNDEFPEEFAAPADKRPAGCRFRPARRFPQEYDIRMWIPLTWDGFSACAGFAGAAPLYLPCNTVK